MLERLPLSPKDQNINALHGYLQKALKAYDLYNSAQPYFGYMQTASYIGRWLAGATPVIQRAVQPIVVHTRRRHAQ